MSIFSRLQPTTYANIFKLQTSGTTAISESSEQSKLSWKKVDLRDNILISEPEIVSVQVDKFLHCRNLMCKKRVDLVSGSKVATCTFCRRKMLASKCQKEVLCRITLEKKDQQYDLTIFSNVLEDYGIDIDDEKLEEQLLVLEDIDIYFNRRRVVTKIQNHPEDLI